MDPISQGAIGAALPLSTRRTRHAGIAGTVGFLAGMAADLDVLIRSSTDPLLFLEYHRQFTHSILFIPVGGVVVAGILFLLFRRRLGIGFGRLWFYCALGYGTHGILDAATSYGTQLLWPFSETRYSVSIISIIDPLLTVPTLGLVILGMLRKNGLWGRIALVWALSYLGFGAYQHLTARAMAQDLAETRGHRPIRVEVKPTFANLVVWKSIYETEERFYVDAVRPSFGATTSAGTFHTKLDVPRDLPWLDPSTQQARDVERFARFSDGFLAMASDDNQRIVDVRYSFLPTKAAPLWSIRLDENAAPTAHVTYETHRADARRDIEKLMAMVLRRE